MAGRAGGSEGRRGEREGRRNTDKHILHVCVIWTRESVCFDFSLFRFFRSTSLILVLSLEYGVRVEKHCMTGLREMRLKPDLDKDLQFTGEER